LDDVFVGIDGCPDGWFFVAIGRDDAFQFDTRERFAELADLLGRARLTLVDIPIGLCSDERQERLCDKAARRATAPRGATVFPAPARGALGLGSYAEGSAENFRLTGRRLSRQSWAIAPKIAQVDAWLRRRPAAGRIREMHPEVAFWALNDKVPLLSRKKTKEGLAERLAVLSRHCAPAEDCYQAARRKFRRREVHDDDIVDALAGAVTARFDGQLATLPEQPARDAHGLPMEIVYADLGCPFCRVRHILPERARWWETK
jgi:predicted RNase H-like nuclease